MKNKVIIKEDSPIRTVKGELKHLGNLKLADSKKAIKVHIFKDDQFYVIPVKEVEHKAVGRVYQYIEGRAEIIGEIIPPLKGSNYWTLNILSQSYLIKDTYINLLKGGSVLSLRIEENE